jgi:hypothetical protein
MNDLHTFVKRLSKVGIDISLTANYPWIYIEKINKVRVTEKYASEWGFVLGYLNKGFVFEDLKEIFKLIRKYK